MFAALGDSAAIPIHERSFFRNHGRSVVSRVPVNADQLVEMRFKSNSGLVEMTVQGHRDNLERSH